MEPPVKRARSETGWNDLPLEMRTLIMNEMELDTLCRLSMCSKMCQNEVVLSKNYCFGLRLKEEVNRSYGLYFIKQSSYDHMKLLVFEKKKGATNVTVRCEDDSKTQIWSKTENKDLVDVVIQYTNKYLVHFRDNLKKFAMEVTNASAKSKLIKAIRIRNMNKLEVLRVEASRKQICLLKHGFVDFEQLKTVTDYLEIPATKLTFEQLIQLQAKTIKIYLMDLTPVELSRFINYWTLGKLHENFKDLEIRAEFNETLAKKRVMFDFSALKYDEIDSNWSGTRESFYVRGECEATEDYVADITRYDKAMSARIIIQLSG